MNHKYLKTEYTLEEYSLQLDKALAGDLHAMERIFEMTSPLIKSSINKYFFGNMPKEDLLQEGYLVVAQCLEDYDREKNIPFLGYAKTRLKFYYMDLGRKSKREECDSLNRKIRGKDGSLEIMEFVEDPTSSTDKSILKCEELIFLSNSLKVITARETQIIKLYYFQNKNMKEISKNLGLSYRTVVNTKTNAIKKLRNQFRTIYI